MKDHKISVDRTINYGNGLNVSIEFEHDGERHRDHLFTDELAEGLDAGDIDRLIGLCTKELERWKDCVVSGKSFRGEVIKWR